MVDGVSHHLVLELLPSVYPAQCPRARCAVAFANSSRSSVVMVARMGVSNARTPYFSKTPRASSCTCTARRGLDTEGVEDVVRPFPLDDLLSKPRNHRQEVQAVSIASDAATNVHVADRDTIVAGVSPSQARGLRTSRRPTAHPAALHSPARPGHRRCRGCNPATSLSVALAPMLRGTYSGSAIWPPKV